MCMLPFYCIKIDRVIEKWSFKNERETEGKKINIFISTWIVNHAINYFFMKITEEEREKNTIWSKIICAHFNFIVFVCLCLCLCVCVCVCAYINTHTHTLAQSTPIYFNQNVSCTIWSNDKTDRWWQNTQTQPIARSLFLSLIRFFVLLFWCLIFNQGSVILYTFRVCPLSIAFSMYILLHFYTNIPQPFALSIE